MEVQSEASLQEQIVLMLRLKGYFVYMVHQNVSNNITRGRSEHAGGYGYLASMVKRGWVKGIPDLHVLGANTDVFVECKSKKGRVSPAQQEVIAKLRIIGKDARIVNDISQIQDLLDKENI